MGKGVTSLKVSRVCMGTFLLVSLMPTTISWGAAPIYVPDLPPGITDLKFPYASSFLDTSGTIWIFWRNDTKIFYSQITDTSKWDITTSYPDYYNVDYYRPPGHSFLNWLSTTKEGLMTGLVIVIVFGTLSRARPFRAQTMMLHERKND